MSMEPRNALGIHLSEDPGVQAFVSDRLFQRRAPAGEKKPLLLIQPPISRVPSRDLDGVNFKRARIQVTAMGETQKQAEDTANAVMTAVEGFSGLMAGELYVILATVDNDRQIAYEDIGEVHHHVDIMITYRE